MNELDNITLNCFANKIQYDSIMKKNEHCNDNNLINDKKFYKKRILDLTKKLFRNEIEDAQLATCFNNYIKSCIIYLKFLDKKDIIQEKYNTMENDNKIKSISEDDNDNIEYNNCDYLLSKPPEVKKINLDSFIINNNNTKTKQKILPQKEIVNIQTKEHKLKGLKKKKNINNIYEDKEKKNKEQCN